MAGEWLKVECSTPDKPETFKITAQMGWSDPDITVGKLFRVWRWFDQQTVDGNAVGVTRTLLDHVSGVTGFAEAMISVGWLVESDDGMALPKFDRHNGESAKSRAQTAKRVASHRKQVIENNECNANTVTETVTPALAREEKNKKRKEEDQKQKTKAPPAALPDPFPGVPPQVVTDFRAMRSRQKAPITPTVVAALQREATKAGLTMEAVLTLCCLRNWRGFQAEWVKPTARDSPAAGRLTVAGQDHSGTQHAMNQSLKRLGNAPDGDINFS